MGEHVAEGDWESANSLMCLPSRSSMESLPSSCSMRIETPMVGLVIEAIQKMERLLSFCVFAALPKPMAARWVIPVGVAMRVTAPGTSF